MSPNNSVVPGERGNRTSETYVLGGSGSNESLGICSLVSEGGAIGSSYAILRGKKEKKEKK